MMRTSACAAVVCVLGLVQFSGGALHAQRDPGGPRTATAGQLVISEFRLRNFSAPADEFIEVYNASGAAHTVAAASGTGYGIATSDGVTRCTIPNGTVIPNHGHYLCVNSAGYSLSSYPAGDGTAAAGDASYSADIPDNVGIAVFNNNSGGGSYSLANRLDAVGSTAEASAIYKEGAGYPALTGGTPSNYAFVRKSPGWCGYNCQVVATPVFSSTPVDTNNNASDFYYADTVGSNPGAGDRLGAPGPENLSSPIALDGTSSFVVRKFSGCVPRDYAPNVVRDPTPDFANHSQFGTIEFRTQWTNNTGASITRLRFRVVELSTYPAASGFADLRVRTSVAGADTIDSYPCGTGTTSVGLVGTTLEEPPSATPGGGGYNTSLGVPSVTAGLPLASGASLNVRMLLGVEQTGIARFCVVPETIPASAGDPWCYIGNTQNAFFREPFADVDSDGRPEMPMYNPATGQWKIRTSWSGYTAEIGISWGGAGYKPVMGDYDGDGRYDVAVYNETTGVWSILTSGSNFTRAWSIGFGGPAYDPVPGDYDGDGTTDIAVRDGRPGATGWLFLASSLGFADGNIFEGAVAGNTPLRGYDFDGDERDDFVEYERATGVWRILKSTTNFSAFMTVTLGGAGSTLVPADYDGDRKPDFGVYDRATGIWRVLKSTEAFATVRSFSWGGPGYLPVPGSYDSDNKADPTLYEPSTGRWLVLRSDASYGLVFTYTHGAAGDVPVSPALVPAMTREIYGGDADGDSVSDLTVYNTTTGIWSTLFSSRSYATARNLGYGGTGYTPAPGDYDGDGLADLAVYQQSTGQWLVRRSRNFSTTYSFNAGGPGYIPVAADYDGDGRTDMVVYNTSTGVWYGRKSSTEFTTTLSVSWGGTGYTAAPGDFDGDGKADLALYQGSSGNWLILKSTTGYTTTITRGFGGAGYTPVQADFDGDGLTDFAVYQASTAVWTMLKSSTNNTAGFAVSYGGSGYTPVAGDWDGDGRADVGVQDAAGTWSILLSNGNFTTSFSRSWGGAGYQPVPVFP